MQYQSFFIAFNFCDTSKETSIFWPIPTCFAICKKCHLSLLISTILACTSLFVRFPLVGAMFFKMRFSTQIAKSNGNRPGQNMSPHQWFFDGFCKTMQITKDQWLFLPRAISNDFFKWLGAKKCHWSNVLRVVLQNHWNYKGPVTCF